MRFLALFVVLLASTVAHSQTADIRPIVLNNVVRIEAFTKSGSLERGYGLIVARQGTLLWIATAEHVLRWDPPMDDGRDYSPQIAVRMQGSTERFELAARPRFTGDGTDIAFLAIRAPLPSGQMFDTWREAVVAGGTVPGEPVAILGSDKDSIEIGPSTGKIGTDPKKVVGLSGAKAQSGAPVSTKTGVIGLYLGSGPNGPQDARIATIGDVAKGAAKREVPWQLVENIGASSYATTVCVKHIGTERPEVIIAGTQTSSSAQRYHCAAVRAGSLPVYAADPDVACTPDVVQLLEQPSQEITLDCRINIAGPWTNASLGGGQFTPISAGLWSFEGLDLGPYGRITGRATGKPPRMHFEGQTAQGRPVGGFISIERGKVSFSFTMLTSDTAFTGVLRR